MDMEEIFGENGGIILLQIVIILLAVVIMVLIYSERITTDSMNQKMDAFKCPDCPKCPNAPPCNCADKGCPDCVCPEGKGCPKCPSCPDCPKSKTLTPEDIADAIFPGRNKGITSHGQYYPLSGLDEKNVQPAYSESVNLRTSYVGSVSGPASVSYEADGLLSKGGSIGLASQKAPPISSGKGLFTPPAGAPKPSAAGTVGTVGAAGAGVGAGVGAGAGAGA